MRGVKIERLANCAGAHRGHRGDGGNCDDCDAAATHCATHCRCRCPELRGQPASGELPNAQEGNA
eukprot:8488055-Alexandrium_andersonii.AAC.1